MRRIVPAAVSILAVLLGTSWAVGASLSPGSADDLASPGHVLEQRQRAVAMGMDAVLGG